MLESFVIAFSMYSRIPMPRLEWSEKSMRYAMLFFPLIGLVIGGAEYAAYHLLQKRAGTSFRAAVMTALPILITGGIHLDGFIDTIDAKRSYKEREEKLLILKDPHIGAFALIYGVLYMLLFFGGASELKKEEMPLFAMSFFLSRILSGLSVVSFPKAKKTGILQEFARMQNRHVRLGLLLELAVCAGLLLWMSPLYGGIMLTAGLLGFAYYYCMSKNVFGGTTGDLAGYFLCLSELMMLLALVFVRIVWM